MALFKDSFNYQELIDCAKGKLAGVDFPKLPLPPMLMFDEVTASKKLEVLTIRARHMLNLKLHLTNGFFLVTLKMIPLCLDAWEWMRYGSY